MTISKLTWLKRTDGHKFTGAEFRVLIAIFNHSDESGNKAFPGLKKLMTETCYGKTTVADAVASLKMMGWITEQSRGSGKSGNSSVFNLVPDAPQPPSSTGGPVQPEAMGCTGGVVQPPEVVPVEWSGSTGGPVLVVPVDRYPTDPLSDPDIRSGSFLTDPQEVRYSPDHREDLVETVLRPSLPSEEEEDMTVDPFVNGSGLTDSYSFVPKYERVGVDTLAPDGTSAENANVIRWPSDKPLPVPFDPFADYVYEDTGAAFEPHAHQRAVVAAE